MPDQPTDKEAADIVGRRPDWRELPSGHMLPRAENKWDRWERLEREHDEEKLRQLEGKEDERRQPETRRLRRRRRFEKVAEFLRLSKSKASDAGLDFVPVSIYLTNENIHEQVESSVEQWLATAGVSIDARDEPISGSWLRYLRGKAKRVAKTPAAREALLTGLHVADSHLVQTQDAYVTATLLQNVGPVLQSLQPTKDAVIRAGALLIVKIDWVVQVYQLTAAQQAVLDHQPKLAASPGEILAALDTQDPVIHEAAIRPAVRADGGGETAAAAAN